MCTKSKLWAALKSILHSITMAMEFYESDNREFPEIEDSYNGE